LASEEAALKLGDSTRRMIAKQTGPRFISNFVAMLLVSGFAVGVAVYVVAEPENARALATRCGPASASGHARVFLLRSGSASGSRARKVGRGQMNTERGGAV